MDLLLPRRIHNWAVWLKSKEMIMNARRRVLSPHRWPRPPPCRCPSRWRTRSCCPFTRRRASLTSPAWRTPSTCSSAACRATSRRASSWPGARVSSWRRTSWCSSGTRCPAFLPLLTWGPRCLEWLWGCLCVGGGVQVLHSFKGPVYEVWSLVFKLACRWKLTGSKIAPWRFRFTLIVL